MSFRVLVWKEAYFVKLVGTCIRIDSNTGHTV